MGKALLVKLRHNVIETIFPARCLACPNETETAMGLCGSCWREVHFFAGPVCDYCGTNVPTADLNTARQICADCDRTPPAWDRGRAAVAYEGVGRQITMAFKHSDRLDMASSLARWMTGAGADILDSNMLVIPVPLHWSRLLKRRYNQAAILAKHVGNRMGAEVSVDALKRTQATKILRGMTRAERHALCADKITAKREQIITGRDVLLIDDVMTTGATLSACAAACREANASTISILTLARVARPE